MKKRILSLIMSVSLVIGTISVNATSIVFEDLENPSLIDIEIIEEIDEDIKDNNLLQTNESNSDSLEATNDFIEAYLIENDFVKLKSSGFIKKQNQLNLSIENANNSKEIDVTNLYLGNVISHNCTLYLGTNYDSTNHWDECTICGKKFNIASHSYSSYWTLGNSCSPSNKLKHICNCGYFYETANTRNHSAIINFCNTAYCARACSVCYNVTQYFGTAHYDVYGRKLGCTTGISGTCRNCGIFWNTQHSGHINYDYYTGSHIEGCFACGARLVNSNTCSFSYLGTSFYLINTVVFSTNITAVSDASFQHSGMGVIDSQSKSVNGNVVTYYIRGHFYDGIEQPQNLKMNIIGSNIGITSYVNLPPEIEPPIINEIKEENLAVKEDWVTAKQLTISGTENHCKSVNISMVDEDGNVYLNNISTPVSNKNWSYTFIPEIEADESGKTFNITVEDNLGNKAQKEIIYYKTDKKPPTFNSAVETTREWSKSKYFTAISTDFGIKNVSIAFNDLDSFDTADNEEINTFYKQYKLVGDVYGETNAMIYFKDGLENISMKALKIYNLDNTAPTITEASSKKQGTRNAIVTVTANDINTKLDASGSGVVGYAITQNRNVPAESDFQTENTFNLTKSGIWYVWAIDVVGNISKPTAVDVKIEYTVLVNPNKGTLTGDSSYQVISGETITILEPTRTGYTFTGWTVKGTDSSINDNNFTMGSEDAEIVAQWQINKYPVTYIDKDINGNEIGRTTIMVDYDTLVRGSDIGSSNTDNAYHNQYRYISDTSATVTIEGATVYRIFEFCETEKESHLTWNDNNDADNLRPEKYTLKLKQNGIVIDEVELPTDTTDYIFDHLPKYDINGNLYVYEIEAIVSDRYKSEYREDGSLIFQDYQPANFSVIIPKQITLSGLTGSSNYFVSVKGTFYYNDTLTVQPNASFTLTDRNKLTSMEAKVKQDKITFIKEDNVSFTCQTKGNIKVNKSFFAGKWNGSFNFDIKFVMQN